MAYNYGSLAPTIAHEMTHGFDNTGRLYDENGKRKNMWTKEEESKFNSFSTALINEYNNFHLIDSFYVNGKNTLAENIADLGGLNIAYDAFLIALENNPQKDINGYNPKQRFFIAFTQEWRDLLSDKLKENYSKYYMHSPPEYRANGTLYNMNAFYEVFNIKEGKMFRETNQRIEIW